MINPKPQEQLELGYFRVDPSSIQEKLTCMFCNYRRLLTLSHIQVETSQDIRVLLSSLAILKEFPKSKPKKGSYITK